MYMRKESMKKNVAVLINLERIIKLIVLKEEAQLIDSRKNT